MLQDKTRQDKKFTCTDFEVAVESVEPIDDEEWDRVICNAV